MAFHKIHFLASKYFPAHNENRLRSEGDCGKARERILKDKPSNLIYLLEKRYNWMNKYIDGKKIVYELGCGAGLAKFFIKNPNLCLTDVTNFDWVERYEDALNLSFESNSVDAFVCSHMIHHVSQPSLFLKKALDCLKPGGIIVINDVYLSLALRFLLRSTHHEGWSYDIDVFSDKEICNKPDDPWSGNNAIPKLLFKSRNKFESTFKGSEIIHYKLCEFLIFPISGGVITKVRTLNLPKFILNIIHKLDCILIKYFPDLFALGMEVLIHKKL